MKLIASPGLLLLANCAWRVVAQWTHQGAIEKTLRFVVITGGGGWRHSVLFRWDSLGQGDDRLRSVYGAKHDGRARLVMWTAAGLQPRPAPIRYPF